VIAANIAIHHGDTEYTENGPTVNGKGTQLTLTLLRVRRASVVVKQLLSKTSGPGGIRTPNQGIMSPLL
jgi:hypothetical protein